MKSIEDMEYHPTAEKLASIISQRAQSTDPLFFRVLVGYYFSVIASHMRCTIDTQDLGNIPVNFYGINLAPSGFGKNRAINLIEEEVTHLFRSRFMEETFPTLAEINLPKLALKRANRKSTDPDEELARVQKEFDAIGEMFFSFSEATSPAIKQLRHKFLMANAAALSLEVDEIGSNLQGITEALGTYLEMYDRGKIKPKLIKSSSDNKRVEEIIGVTPANAMLFGTPSKLFDGAVTENVFYEFLDTGYARRCFFGYAKEINKSSGMTAEQIFAHRVDQGSAQFLEELSSKFEALADMINVNRKLIMAKETSILLTQYQLDCQALASKLPTHATVARAELENRYFKVLKLAGAYAFVDDVPELTEEHIYNAIKLAEESGAAFQQMMNRDRPYVKLAKYLAEVGKEVTQADLVEDLPFYKGGMAQKNEMITLATAYGYKNNIIIKKSFADGIEFLRGEALKPTDLSKMVLSYSTEFTEGYRNEYAPFDQLHKLTQAPGMHWVAHHLNGGYRNEENCIPGFNLVVIDVDGGVSLSTVRLLLKNYKYLIYTTKRHSETENRFRLILPINYELALDAKDYKEFMSHIYEWLPFEVDTATKQRARKWLTHEGHYEYNEGEVLDALPFIPKTSKNEERKAQLDSQQSLDNLERWVLNNSGDGNRNNMLIRYALILVDAGFDFEGVRSRVVALNDKMPDKLDESEVMGTVMVTVAKAISKR